MIVLKALLEPFWATCPFAPTVSVHLRRLTSMELREARQTALAVIRTLRESDQALGPYGLSGPDVLGQRFSPADPAQMVRIGMLVESVECAHRALIEWRGVVDEARQPAPITLKTLAVLLLDDRFDGWLRGELEKARQILDVEKNVSGLSPSGGAGAGKTASDRTTATAASKPASPAPKAARAKAAGSAPASRTRRRPAKA